MLLKSFLFLKLLCKIRFNLSLSVSLSSSSSPCVLLVETTACVVECRRIECEGASVRLLRSLLSYAPIRSVENLASFSAPSPPPPSLLLLGHDGTAIFSCKTSLSAVSGTTLGSVRDAGTRRPGMFTWACAIPGAATKSCGDLKKPASDPNPQLFDTVSLTFCYSIFVS